MSILLINKGYKNQVTSQPGPTTTAEPFFPPVKEGSTLIYKFIFANILKLLSMYRLS